MIQTKIQLSGLTCVACTKLTAKRIKLIPGVTEAVVDLETEIADITADREVTKVEVVKVLEGTKYTIK